MIGASPALSAGKAAGGRVPFSLALLALIALACVFGPIAASHPFDRVYPDYVLAPPSLATHPNLAEARLASQDIAQRLGVRVESLRQNGAKLEVTLVGERPIDAQSLQFFARSDVVRIVLELLHASFGGLHGFRALGRRRRYRRAFVQSISQRR